MCYLITGVFVYSAFCTCGWLIPFFSDSVVLLDYVEPFFYFFVRVCLEIIENDYY